ncbi:MAG: TIGR00730 family Rossman fold protein, partial [Duncaniella sp.]|nr:TIGR00730 family Rossman fold protein [Duncaniella sp.]
MNSAELHKPSGVAVYGASRSTIAPVYLEAARRMGRLIARAGLTLVCGGGRGGMMAAAIDGAIEAGGPAVGVLPHFMIERDWADPRLTRTIDTPDMHIRKATMASLSRAVVAMAGGIGTLDELAEMMTWRQLHLFAGSVIIVNTEGFFDPLIEMFDRMTAQGFMRPGGLPAVIVDTPE